MTLPEPPLSAPPLSDAMSPAASTLVVKAGGGGMLVTILIRLAAVHVISIYAGIFAVIHWLRDVPLLETWTVGVIGCVMLFLAIGVMLTGRLLGYFRAPGGGLSVDWVPPLLIWPMGLSLWGCLALGLGSIQGHQDIANGMEMPLTLLAATLPPLFLGRLLPWPKPMARWHRLLDVHYVLATVVAAGTLYLAMQVAITSASPAPGGQAAATAPKSGGFACDPSKAGQGETEEEIADNQCPTTPAANSPSSHVVAALPLIDQNFSSWGCFWMLLSGAALIAGRAVAARGRNPLPAVTAGARPLGLGEQEAQLAKGLVTAAGAQVATQAGGWLRNSGIPNADILADVVGNLLRPRGSASGVPNMNLRPPPATPALAATVPLAPAAPAVPEPPPAPPTPTVASPPPPESPTPAPAATVVSPATDSAETAKLKANLGSMAKTLAAQQDTTAKLQSSVGSLQDKLEQQAQVMTQMMAEAQQSAEESRRTIDSLTRLAQGMKGDLERLARNQAQ